MCPELAASLLQDNGFGAAELPRVHGEDAPCDRTDQPHDRAEKKGVQGVDSERRLRRDGRHGREQRTLVVHHVRHLVAVHLVRLPEGHAQRERAGLEEPHIWQ